MWRGILRYCGEFVLIIVLLTILFWMDALPDHRFIPLLVMAGMALAQLFNQVDKVDKKIETLAKKMNISLEESSPKEAKKIILSE
jgi:hypothetical protein